MTLAKIVFMQNLSSEIATLIKDQALDNMEVTLLDHQASKEVQIKSLEQTKYLILYAQTLSDDVLRESRNLEFIQLLSAGYDQLNLKLMKELGIQCANNGGANSWAVSDHAVLLMLSLYRKLVVSDRSTRTGSWNQPIDGANTFELANKKVGILGIGRIGKQVARRVQGFDAEVQYYDKYPLSKEEDAELNVTSVDLEDLFKSSDVITCHTSLSPDTYHIVSREMLGMMKPESILINTSRGDVIDEDALIEALVNKKISGAGLDVFEQEPIDPENRLLNMDNVVLTPHAAGTTWDTWFRRANFAYENISRMMDGLDPISVVNKHA